MNSRQSLCDNKEILDRARQLGIDRVGITAATHVDDTVSAQYRRWLDDGMNAGMAYLNNYLDLRDDPTTLLEGTQTVISCAVSYHHRHTLPPDNPAIASYAHGDDYHEVLREKLESLAMFIRLTCGGETRVCVDTAPVRERYWAVRSGIAFRGRSGLAIIPGLGTYCFLGEILTTALITPTPPGVDRDTCIDCGLCISSCPGHAINPDGTVNANKCLSYLTIEHRGELPDGVSTGGRLYGCDTCQTVCPHNNDIADTAEPRFLPRPEYAGLTPERIASLTPEEYARIFRRSAIKRTKLAGLLRNIKHL